jgi:hypothetical protein
MKLLPVLVCRRMYMMLTTSHRHKTPPNKLIALRSGLQSLKLWGRRQQVPLNRYYPCTTPHDVISWNTEP